MDPSDPNSKAFFLALVKSFNEDVQLENLHRNNLFKTIVMSMAWMATAILWICGIQLLPPWLITAYGVILLPLLGSALYNIHLNHKRHVTHSLRLRQLALDFKDGIN